MRYFGLALALVVGCAASDGSSVLSGDDDGDSQHATDDATSDHDVADNDPDDQDSGDPGPGTTHCPTTIANIKTGAVNVGDNACLDNLIVTAVGPHGVFVSSEDQSAEVNDGLYLYNPGGPSVAIADIVDVGTAPVQVYAGELQLAAPVLTIESPGSAPPTPVVISVTELASASTATGLEGMLVFVSTVTVTSVDMSTFTVSDDGGTHSLIVGEFLSDVVLNINVGDTFDSITGIVRATNGAFHLEPRGEYDLEASF